VVDRIIEPSMSVVEMRMFIWVSGVSRENRIRNEYVGISIGVASIGGQMKDNRLRWFGSVLRREEAKLVRS